MSIVINIANDFSKYPGGRYRTDGDASGEAFREDILEPALKKPETKITIQMDGALGYGSSFLDEAFAGIVRKKILSAQELLSRIQLQTHDPSLKFEIEQYIQEAEQNN